MRLAAAGTIRRGELFTVHSIPQEGLEDEKIQRYLHQSKFERLEAIFCAVFFLKYRVGYQSIFVPSTILVQPFPAHVFIY